MKIVIRFASEAELLLFLKEVDEAEARHKPGRKRKAQKGAK